MDIYLKRRRWKILLLFIAIIIGIASLAYTNWLTKKMSVEERKKVELWAEAIKRINNARYDFDHQETDDLNTDYLSFLNLITTQNTTIPIIIIKPDGSINLDANINYNTERREIILAKELEKMKDDVDPIRI